MSNTPASSSATMTFSPGFRDALNSLRQLRPAWAPRFNADDDGDESAGIGDAEDVGYCPFTAIAEVNGVVVLTGPEGELIGRFEAPTGLLAATLRAIDAFDPVAENLRDGEDTLGLLVDLGAVDPERAARAARGRVWLGDAAPGPYPTNL